MIPQPSGGQNREGTAQGQTGRAILEFNEMISALLDRNHALGVVATEDRGWLAVDPGRPAGHPGVGNDQKAGCAGRDFEYGSVRVPRQPPGSCEQLSMIDWDPGQGIFRHQNRGARVAGSEAGQDHRGIVVDDLGTGNHVGAGQGGRVALNHVGFPRSLVPRATTGQGGSASTRSETRAVTAIRSKTPCRTCRR